ncbi:MAG: HIT family protein [Halothiobacillus sp. 24-54-40]|jgi:diadenosine tetraphosphate (Ap4A) HIT family hydrolase|nr:MAG: HIT family protein [Halothiobacillus sp. 35-54-62]OYZ88063.1 MAG: HIT family protein [Halothiobacillus sp. 24-54-40]OZA81550.1 MAG: HIT family protein [Halothiobacillus sp. 39-53-45]HQS02966.1 HIT domain-containing protein [Halothiobacillus sp.]HQS29527.1 HIT domain-containing protein [Halothiobacillus sp.]
MTPSAQPNPSDQAWQIHPQLLADSVPIIHLPICAIRLLDDQRFPWVLLMPRQAGLTQWLDVPAAMQHQILDEIQLVSTAMNTLFKPRKINLATIGNQVDQLHIHCVARHMHDAAWPNVVWGHGTRSPYPTLQRLALANAIAALLKTRSAPNSPAAR